MVVQPGKTYIGKLRARSSERDTLALQLRLTSVLSASNLHPPGLPTASIVCIRILRDPLPGALRLQRSGMRPPHAWEQAISASLKRLVEHAAWPGRGPVPTNAEAVIFADRAEMLACLANDWCEGNASGRWWWQGLFRGKDVGQWLVPSWLDTPEYIPAALQHLAIQGKAVPFVRALQDSDIHTMLQRVIRSFALHELQFISQTPAQILSILEAGTSSTSTFPTERGREVPEALAQPSIQVEPTQESPLQPTLSSPTVHLQHKTHRWEASATPQSISPNRSTHQRQPAEQTEFHVAPWQSWVPETGGMSSELPRDRQSLLGIGLMLMRAPAVVRTASFARAVLQWWRAERLSLPSDTARVTSHAEIEHASEQQRVQFSNPDSAKRSSKPPMLAERERDTSAGLPDISDEEAYAAISHKGMQVPGSETARPVREAVVSEAGKQAQETLFSEARKGAQEHIQILASGSVDSSSETARLPAPQAIETSFKTAATALPSAAAPIINQRQPGTVELIEAKVETELGGLFYLINLGLFLNLYGDFTTPLQPGLSLSIWDFITLLGQQLLGGAKADPVWLFLMQLAGGSEQEAPGKDFDAPDSWRVPGEWLKPFSGEGPWRWSVNHRRLQVQHPAQFFVLDLPLYDGDPVKQLQREMEAFTDLWHGEVSLVNDLVHDEGVPLVGSLPPQVERWLRWLMPYIRLRLQRALGLSNANDVAGILCEHHARIFLTATHLDIFFSLAKLPIEVRLSGLDRDPGWVPAAGRFIAFHFT